MKILLRKNNKGEQEINWTCLREKCPENCCGYFRDRSPDYRSVKGIHHDEMLILSDEVGNFSDDVLSRQGKNYYLKLEKDRSCPLFNAGKCKQFEDRPSVCKAYPFYIDLFTGLNIDMSCPGAGVGVGWTQVGRTKAFATSFITVLQETFRGYRK